MKIPFQLQDFIVAKPRFAQRAFLLEVPFMKLLQLLCVSTVANPIRFAARDLKTYIFIGDSILR